MRKDLKNICLNVRKLKGINLLKEQFCVFLIEYFKNPFQTRDKKLDQWQIELLKMMHNLGKSESIVVTAQLGLVKSQSCSLY